VVPIATGTLKMRELECRKGSLAWIHRQFARGGVRGQERATREDVFPS